MILLLVACGATGEPLRPVPGPTPPPQLERASVDTIAVAGTIVDSTPATRAWTIVGEGRRYYCVLAEDGRLLLGEGDISVEDLRPDTSIAMDGSLFGDVLLVKRAVVTVPAGEGGAPAITDALAAPAPAPSPVAGEVTPGAAPEPAGGTGAAPPTGASPPPTQATSP